jgi:acyl-CoA thioesterase
MRSDPSPARSLRPDPGTPGSARAFLGLQATHNPHRWVLPVRPAICTPADFLFGGSGLAAAAEALEAATGRPLVWATAQYLSFARPPSILDLDTRVAVAGRSVTQARAVGHVGDREIFTVNAALGRREFDAEGQWVRKPAAPPPEACPPARRWWAEGIESIHSRVELRVADGKPDVRDGTPSPDGRSLLWARFLEPMDEGAAALALVADFMPSGIGRALGRHGGGNSLDNTLRVLDVARSEWVLGDIRVHGLRNGFAHGLMHLWSQDGRLLATGSQSAIVRIHEPPADAAR